MTSSTKSTIEQVVAMRKPLYAQSAFPVIFSPDDKIPDSEYIVDATIDYGGVATKPEDEETADKWDQILESAKYIIAGNQVLGQSYTAKYVSQNGKVKVIYGGVPPTNGVEAPHKHTVGVIGAQPADIFSLEWASSILAGIINQPVFAFAKPRSKITFQKKTKKDEGDSKPDTKKIKAKVLSDFVTFASSITELIALYPDGMVFTDTVAIALASLGVPIYMRLRPYMTGTISSLYAIGGFAGPTITEAGARKQLNSNRRKYDIPHAWRLALNINEQATQMIGTLR